MDQTFFGEKNPTVICKKSNGYLGILKKSNGKNPTVAESKKNYAGHCGGITNRATH